jgi:predicted NBD/HSP70 family sugar kinase
MSNLWGIDLGGTKIEGVILKSKDDPEVLIRERIPTNSHKGYDHILNQIIILVDSISDKTGESPKRIGIGTPGSMEPGTGMLKNCNSTSLNQKPFLEDIQRKLGVPVSIANDANCFTLAEANMGSAKMADPNASIVFGVIMGTGVGGGVVVDGKPLNGHQGIGGEWGHNYLDASGGSCYCGKNGCVETVIAGPSLEGYYESISGESSKLKDIYERHIARTDKNANKTMERLIHFFALGLSNVVNILDPDVIVIGGGVGNIDLLYTEGVAAMEEFVFNPTFNTKIVKPILGDSAGVFGAAFLVA